jgi:hypothetical protein
LEFSEVTVHLVTKQHWLNFFFQCLGKHSLGLDGAAFDTADNNESTISNTEGGGDFSGEIDMAW